MLIFKKEKRVRKLFLAHLAEVEEWQTQSKQCQSQEDHLPSQSANGPDRKDRRQDGYDYRWDNGATFPGCPFLDKIFNLGQRGEEIGDQGCQGGQTDHKIEHPDQAFCVIGKDENGGQKTGYQYPKGRGIRI